MRTLTLVVHTSLDGFVAGINGELNGFPKGEENLAFVCQLTGEADVALFGRISYGLLNSYWPTAKESPTASKGEIAYSIWYNAAQKIVVSKSMSGEVLDNTVILGENIPDEIRKLKHQEGKDILLFGSPSIAQLLMQYNLIDSYWIFINPVIFGKGIPLFATMEGGIDLRLVETKQFPNGEFALNYIMVETEVK